MQNDGLQRTRGRRARVLVDLPCEQEGTCTSESASHDLAKQLSIAARLDFSV